MTEPTVDLDTQVHRVFRRAGWVASIVAILVGLFGLLFPVTALAALALIVGVYLLVAGVMRLTTAFTSREFPTAWRVMLGVIGALLLIAGVLTLNNPFGTLVAIVFVVGIGWIIDGIGYAVAAFRVHGGGGVRWALLLAGVLLVIAGIVLLVVPVGALASVQYLASILLLAVGVVSLIGLIVSGVRARR